MRKISTLFSLVAALSLAAIPTAANADMSRARVEVVYNSAVEMCPVAYAGGTGAAQRMMSFADREGYSSEEKILFLNFCLMFGKGISKGLDMAINR